MSTMLDGPRSNNIILRDNLRAAHTTGPELTALVKKYLRCKDESQKGILKETIFNNSIRMIRKATVGIVGSNSDFIEDAFQAACICFFDGLDKFKPSKKASFGTYIFFWITKGVREEFHTRGIISVSRSLYKDARFENLKNGRMVKLDKPRFRTDGTYLDSDCGDIPRCTRPIASKLLEDADSAEYFKRIINDYLSPLEAMILKLRYFYDEKPALKEISVQLKVSPQLVQVSEVRALHKMKDLICNGYISVRYKTKTKHRAVNESSDSVYEKIMSRRDADRGIVQSE